MTTLQESMDIRVYSERGEHLRASPWHAAIESVDSIDDVLSLTRDYLATLSPEHLARLPPSCRPGRIKGEDDLSYWSDRLASWHEEPGTRVDAELLQELLDYFLHAWLRVTHLRRRRSLGEELH